MPTPGRPSVGNSKTRLWKGSGLLFTVMIGPGAVSAGAQGPKIWTACSTSSRGACVTHPGVPTRLAGILVVLGLTTATGPVIGSLSPQRPSGS